MSIAYTVCDICYTVGHEAMVCPYIRNDNPRFTLVPQPMEDLRIHRQATAMYRILALHDLASQIPIDIRQQYDANVEIWNEVAFIRNLTAQVLEWPLQNLTVALLPVVRYIDDLAGRAVENLDYGVHVQVYASALDYAFTLALELACGLASLLLEHYDQEFDIDFGLLDRHMMWLIDEMDHRGDLRCEEEWAILLEWRETLERYGIVGGESRFYHETLSTLRFLAHQARD